MVNKEINIYANDSAPAKDWFLQFLVNLANKNRFELDVTLTVGGMLISGTLVGVKHYFDDLSAFFASPFESDKKSEEIKETFKEIGEQCTCVSPSEQSETPSYVHLKNAHFFDAQSKLISGNEGIWWRGRISEVQGFSAGRLS
ncbi:MAG: gas vesicle accessory protein GvpU [Desulforhopalus sp.]